MLAVPLRTWDPQSWELYNRLRFQGLPQRFGTSLDVFRISWGVPQPEPAPSKGQAISASALFNFFLLFTNWFEQFKIYSTLSKRFNKITGMNGYRISRLVSVRLPHWTVTESIGDHISNWILSLNCVIRAIMYCVFKKAWPNLYISLLYKFGQDFLDRQYLISRVNYMSLLVFPLTAIC